VLLSAIIISRDIETVVPYWKWKSSQQKTAASASILFGLD